MPLFMYQAAYTPESWAAQVKNPQDRIERAARPACEAVGGKLVGGWLCFGEYNIVVICNVSNIESGRDCNGGGRRAMSGQARHCS